MIEKSEFQDRYENQIRKRKMGQSKEFEITQNDEIIKYAGQDNTVNSNCIIFSNFNSDCETKIDAEFEYFLKKKHSFIWQVYDSDVPAELAEKLKSRGMIEKNTEYLMGLNLENYSVEISKDVMQIKTISDLEILDNLFAQVWDPTHKWVRDVVRKAIINQTPTFKVFAFVRDGMALSAGWMRFHEGTDFSSLWGGMTLPQFRQRGFYTQLVNARCMLAKESGYKFVSVNAWSTSRSALIRNGFIQHTRIANYIYQYENSL